MDITFEIKCTTITKMEYTKQNILTEYNGNSHMFNALPAAFQMKINDKKLRKYICMWMSRLNQKVFNYCKNLIIKIKSKEVVKNHKESPWQKLF